MNKNIVIVGGVAGGMSFATRYRRLNQNDNITVIEKGEHVSFANCGLPYFISDEISDRNDLLVAKKAMLEDRFKLNILNNHEAISIDSTAKTIKVVNKGQVKELAYDELILSPGASPIFIPVVGINKHPNVYTLRNIPDADQIKAAVANKEIKSALVIGGGFIGLEMAESLSKAGLDVAVVELADHLLAQMDIEMAIMAHTELKANNIKVFTNNSVKEFVDNKAILSDNQVIDADMVIMSVGVKAETGFLKDSNIELGMRDAIIVDSNYQTSVNNIHAIGDAIITKHEVSQADALIALAGPANRQGRHLADILNGIKRTNKGSLGTSILRLFNKTFATTGLNEKALDQDSIEVMHLYANNHAGYFPNAKAIDLKVIYDKYSHKILGAQAVGYEGVDKRIDVLATAISAGMRIFDLQDLDLAYAPPFGSAKDIINMAGYYADNINLGLTDTIQWHQLEKDALILDVRNSDERTNGFIKDSINIPLDQLRDNLDKLDKDKEIVVHCQSGIRSYNAERILKVSGYQVKNLDGGYNLYGQLIKEGVVENV